MSCRLPGLHKNASTCHVLKIQPQTLPLMTNQDGPDGQRAAEARVQQHELKNTSEDVQEESLRFPATALDSWLFLWSLSWRWWCWCWWWGVGPVLLVGNIQCARHGQGHPSLNTCPGPLRNSELKSASTPLRSCTDSLQAAPRFGVASR